MQIYSYRIKLIVGCMNSVLILAGGKSERMRFPKSYLSLNGKTFLDTIVNEYYNAGIKKICVVLNSEFYSGTWRKFSDEVKAKADIIENEYPEAGRFYSIKLGLKNLADSEYCFIQNIDNPFISKKVILDLLDSKNPDGYTSPTYKEKSGHPVLISKVIIQHINTFPDENHKLSDLLSCFPQKRIECKEDVLMNINTPEEYEFYTNSNLVS